jgi:hypothetical protein
MSGIPNAALKKSLPIRPNPLIAIRAFAMILFFYIIALIIYHQENNSKQVRRRLPGRKLKISDEARILKKRRDLGLRRPASG